MKLKSYILKLEPRISDIVANHNHFVKPLIERPFLPQEVDNLADTHNLQKKKLEYSMETAQLVGNPVPNTPGEEKPSIYSTVYQSHVTSVIHPVPQPETVKIPKQESFGFSSDGSLAPADLSSGQHMQVSVQFAKDSMKDATMSGYEAPELKGKAQAAADPSFIQLNEKNHNRLELSPEQSVASDIDTFTANFKNCTKLSDKVVALIDGRAKLLSEANQLKKGVLDDVKNLIESKRLAIRLNDLVQKYEKKLITDQEEKSLKLADEITLKEQLIEKLKAELQGIRTSPSQYPQLEIVNPEDIDRIRNEVVTTLQATQPK